MTTIRGSSTPVRIASTQSSSTASPTTATSRQAATGTGYSSTNSFEGTASATALVNKYGDSSQKAALNKVLGSSYPSDEELQSAREALAGMKDSMPAEEYKQLEQEVGVRQQSRYSVDNLLSSIKELMEKAAKKHGE